MIQCGEVSSACQSRDLRADVGDDDGPLKKETAQEYLGALAVIVGSGYGYVRPDGVAVIPIGALGS
jgi:hypothetical protein